MIGGLYTLYLAISHPDPIVVDDGQYREIRSELQAEPHSEPQAAETQHAIEKDP